MSLPSAFDPSVTQDLLARLSRLDPNAQPKWDRMDAAQMMAHCAVAYELLQGDRTERLSWPMRVLNQLVFKWKVVSERPYPEDLPTPDAPVKADPEAFTQERARLAAYIATVHGVDAASMEGRRHPFFGALSARQWSTLFYKHLDHHLRQFGV